jgi:hypothetical protein
VTTTDTYASCQRAKYIYNFQHSWCSRHILFLFNKTHLNNKHWGGQKCLQNRGRKTWREETTGRIILHWILNMTWIDLAQDKAQCWARVNTVMNLRFPWGYSSHHQTACFKVTEGLHSPYRAALSQQYSVARFAKLRVLSCLHSPGLRRSCSNVVRICCDLEACDLVTAAIVTWLGGPC